MGLGGIGEIFKGGGVAEQATDLADGVRNAAEGVTKAVATTGTAQDALNSIFGSADTPHAGTVNLVISNNQSELVVETLDLGPEALADIKAHAALQGRALDTDKLTAAGIENVAEGATYYAFPHFADAIVMDYNGAMNTASDLYNTIMVERGYGDQSVSSASNVEGVGDINELRGWETTERILEGAAEGFKSDPAFDAGDHQILLDQVAPAIENLQNAGALAVELSEIHYQQIKPPAPGMEVEEFDYNSLLRDGAGVGLEGGVMDLKN